MNIECTCMSDSVSTEILMLVLGAVLGLLASLFTMIIQRFLDKKGKLNIFIGFLIRKEWEVQHGDLTKTQMEESIL